MRLSEGIMDRQYKIINLVGGRGARRRLLDMGLTIGVIIKVIVSHAHGPVLIEVRETRLGLGHGLAMKIIIAEIE